MNSQNVPGIDNAPQFSTSVPGVALPRRQEFTEQGQAYEHLGEGVESAANKGAEIADEIARQHDLSQAQSAAVQMGIDHNQKALALAKNSPDGFMHEDDGSITKNADGSQRTIVDEYRDGANIDYQDYQDKMTPRGAAIFREKTLEEVVGKTTKGLQHAQIIKQHDAADESFKGSQAIMARDNDRNPYTDQNTYYNSYRDDGSINIRGNTDKINQQLRDIKLFTAQQGPLKDANGLLKPGAYGPTEVQGKTAERLANHADDWTKSAVTDILENDTPRNHKSRVSTTAVQQVVNLRDVIEGKDPKSIAASAKGLPTVNSSLTNDQRDKWRNQLNSMLDGAQKIDRSEYELAIEQLKASTKSGGYQTVDALIHSPEFGHALHAAEPLGLTPEKQAQDMSDIFGNAARTAGHSGVSDLSSDATKRQQIEQNLRSFEIGWPQYAAMSGVKFAGGMDKAILGEAGKSAYSQLDEESRQFREDPAKFAAQVSSGPQDPNKGIKYRSATMKAVEDKLYSDPSVSAPLNPMSNGKPLIVNAIKEMKRIGAMGFGQGFEPNFLSKDDYQSWANKIKNTAPEQVEKMFQQLQKVAGPDAGTVMEQLVKVGNLDQRFQYSQNLPTSTARVDSYSQILSKNSAVENLAKIQGMSADDVGKEVYKRAFKANQDVIDFTHRVYGADSPEASKTIKALTDTWASTYASARSVKGTSQSDAEKAANERVSSMIPPVATVQDSHHFLGMSFGSAGPASRVQFTRPDLSDDQKLNIQASLLKSQKALANATIGELVPPPVKPGDYDFNKKLDMKWVGEHPFVWRPVRTGTPTAAYRFQYMGQNADGSGNGRGYDLQIRDPKGNPVYYEVRESEALKKQGP